MGDFYSRAAKKIWSFLLDLQILLILAENFYPLISIMTTEKTQKKRVVVSYKNLTPELQEEVKKKYPYGYTDQMLRIDKGPGDFFYAIVLETDDTNYLIKVDVKVDDSLEEEEDKEYYNDEIKGADDLADTPDDDEDN